MHGKCFPANQFLIAFVFAPSVGEEGSTNNKTVSPGYARWVCPRFTLVGQSSLLMGERHVVGYGQIGSPQELMRMSGHLKLSFT